jgi:hypothetical protein
LFSLWIRVLYGECTILSLLKPLDDLQHNQSALKAEVDATSTKSGPNDDSNQAVPENYLQEKNIPPRMLYAQGVTFDGRPQETLVPHPGSLGSTVWARNHGVCSMHNPLWPFKHAVMLLKACSL